jgi:hypothetical protein
MKNQKSKQLSRRKVLKQILGTGICLPCAQFLSLVPSSAQSRVPEHPAASPSLSQEDDKFLDDLENRNFQYFWEQANPKTGLVKDRCNVKINDEGIVASIAATGFGLTALCLGQKHGWIPLAAARERALTTLRFLWRKLPNHRGFFYHWANINTGERVWDSEVSSVDTAILLCGVITCQQYFQHWEISQLAHDIFNRVDWTWLSEDTTLLPHGWTPEFGFLPYRWDHYSELMMMYLLGLGSSSHPLRPEAWYAWKRLTFDYDGLRYIGSFAPLFIHQYSQAWFDFRGKRDRFADYFQNSAIATEAHRRFCLELSKQFPTYKNDMWGITASDSQTGYVVWGGPPAVGPIDGTLVPSASAGSLPFLPQPVMLVLQTMKNRYGTAWSKYGFVNAFNPLTNWYDNSVIGIDTGITMLMAENTRTGFVWETFMKSPEARRGMDRAGFRSYYQPRIDDLKGSAAAGSQ